MGGFNLTPEQLSDLGIDNSTTMQYGKYTFTPVPLINLSKENQKTGGGEIIGTLYNMTLQGTLTPYPTGIGGIDSISNLQHDFLEAFAATGVGLELIIKCSDTEIIKCRPRVNSVDFAEGNWVERCDYTVNLEYDVDTATSGLNGENMGVAGSGINGDNMISDFSESWDIQKSDENYYKITWLDGTEDVHPDSFIVTHNISAVGKPDFVDGQLVRPAYKNASGYIKPLLGYEQFRNDGIGLANGVICPEPEASGGQAVIFNQNRTVQIDKSGGSYNVTETWTVYPEASYASGINAFGAKDDWNADVSQSTDSSLVTVSLAGTITGAASGQLCDYSNDNNKYDNAQSYFEALDAESASYERARYFMDKVNSSRGINRVPTTTSIGHNPRQGTISYSYVFDTRPSGCLENALKTEITVSETNAHDVFAELTVLGRASGPVLQSMGTVTSTKRSISLDATMRVGEIDCVCSGIVDSSPSLEAKTVMEQYRPDNCGIECLTIFKTADTENWNPSTGKYSRQMGWTYSTCEDCP